MGGVLYWQGGFTTTGTVKNLNLRVREKGRSCEKRELMRRRALQLRPVGPPSSRGIPNDPSKDLVTPPSSTRGSWQAKRALVSAPSSGSEARRSPSCLDFRGDVEASAAPGNGDSQEGIVSLR